MRSIKEFQHFTKGLAWVLGAAVALASAGVEAGPVYPIASYTGEGSPVIGAQVVASGGDVTATYVSGGGAYTDLLYVSSPTGAHTNANPSTMGSNWIFDNHSSVSGQTVDLGTFAAGTVITFNVLVNDGVNITNYYSGAASLNPDSTAHAFVDSAYTGPYGGTLVGFEDCFACGGGGYYEDLRYSFTNVQSSVPSPATVLLVASGLVGVAVARKRRAATRSAV